MKPYPMSTSRGGSQLSGWRPVRRRIRGSRGTQLHHITLGLLASRRIPVRSNAEARPPVKITGSQKLGQGSKDMVTHASGVS